MKKLLSLILLLVAGTFVGLAGTRLNGDVNNDSEVNIADVNAVISIILGGHSNSAGDVNHDGEINIADVNAIIDIILNSNIRSEERRVGKEC